MMPRRLFSLWVMIVTLLLAGCAGVPEKEVVKEKDPVIEAERLFASGEYRSATEAFNELAKESSGPQQTSFLLRTAAALARDDRVHQSRQILETVQLDPRNVQQRFLLNLTEAHIALMERRAEDALRILQQSPSGQIDHAYLADYHLLRADARTMLGDRIDTASELVNREQYLQNPQLIEENQQAIWEALARMNERTLARMRIAVGKNVLGGWMELVQIAKTYQLDPEVLKRRVDEWHQSYPDHPVQENILKGLLERRLEDIILPQRLAVLLPFDSRFGQAAEAIRDGIIAAYYSRPHHADQRIRFYDSGSDPATALAAYKQALAEDSDFVIGPLNKESIEWIADKGTFPVPTLALNYTLEQDAPDTLYQFGLSPEEEARQVAERTWLDGHVNSAALIPSGSWGERVYTAFQQRWEQLGGQVIEIQQYNAEQQDFSAPIQDLLNINESRRRARSLRQLLSQDIKFEPRRRKDMDFIFLAAYPRQARQIRPQLKFYHAADVPVYATSHVFAGGLNQERDRDMDGLMFGDMPWVLAGSTAHRGLRPTIEPYISRAGNSLQRLYALGIDAYNIIAALNTLKAYPYERYDGETGSLSLDPQQRVQRQLTWVKFRSGRPVALDEGL
ncbi:penicillin-binding protein activator [Thiohalophilus sp.]|uniref:penicillin-binding protein activator n=1 Tax=Thiohalophilus sp. TaxID=3028392 RepID=UPI002ACEC2FC|nr:penicillin-binding protein activator [Thiohalophilus sp.]MDZ7662303.1 penicillin-binding protein activator [Thiohalophilus sp.]